MKTHEVLDILSCVDCTLGECLSKTHKTKIKFLTLRSVHFSIGISSGRSSLRVCLVRIDWLVCKDARKEKQQVSLSVLSLSLSLSLSD
jgi:hypothetical protein